MYKQLPFYAVFVDHLTKNCINKTVMFYVLLLQAMHVSVSAVLNMLVRSEGSTENTAWTLLKN